MAQKPCCKLSYDAIHVAANLRLEEDIGYGDDLPATFTFVISSF
jgi:hypothetical protein